MKKLLFIFFLALAGTAFGQKYPADFDPDTTVTGAEFIPYQVKTGSTYSSYKIPLEYAKRYFSPDVPTSTISYVPTSTGNWLNRMKFLRHTDGRIWYVDGNGNSILLFDPAAGGTCQAAVITSNLTVSDAHCKLYVDCTAGNVTITLPGSLSASKTIEIIREDATSNRLTIAATFSDGSSQKLLWGRGNSLAATKISSSFYIKN